MPSLPDVRDRVGDGQAPRYPVSGGEGSRPPRPAFAVDDRLRAWWQAGYQSHELFELLDGRRAEVPDRDTVPLEAQRCGGAHVVSGRLFLLVEKGDKHAETISPELFEVGKRRVPAAD